MNELRKRDDELLQRWLAGDATADDERELTIAAGASPQLAAEIAAHRRVMAELRALPPAIAPGRDLWPEIAGRIAPPRRRARWALAAGLAAGLGVAAVVAVRFGAEPRPDGEARAAVAERPETAAPAYDLAAYAATDRDLAAIRAELRRTIEARRDSLPPATRRLVFDSLETIERAIADIEAALAKQPADPGLSRTYIEYREREIDLLRKANRWVARL